MKRFEITWNQIFYSVPTIEKTVFNGEIIYTNPDKAVYVIKTSDDDLIIFKDHQFFNVHGHQLDSDTVIKSFEKNRS